MPENSPSASPPRAAPSSLEIGIAGKDMMCTPALTPSSSEKRATEYLDLVKKLDGLSAAVSKLTEDKRPEVVASAAEFVLEGLHLNRKLNCERTAMGYLYNR